MKKEIFIPTIGTKLKLVKAWKFDLYNEYRNDTLWDNFGCDEMDASNDYVRFSNYDGTEDSMYPATNREYRSNKITIPKSSILIVDRIYIRKGKDAKRFDSVSFFVVFPDVEHDGTPITYFNMNRKGVFRFWAKLDAVNTINCVVV